jgi:hypothetical protein
MATPRTEPDRRPLAAALIVARKVFERVRAAGAKLDLEPAFALIEAGIRGEAGSKEIAATATRIFQQGTRLVKPLDEGALRREAEQHAPPLDVANYWCASATSQLLRAVDASELSWLWWVLNKLALGLLTGDLAARQKLVADLHTAALAEAATQTFPPRPEPPPPAPDPPSPALLEASKAKLPEPIRPLLDLLHAERRPHHQGKPTALRKRLRERGYTPHRCVLEFERDFGGLFLPEPGEADWFDEGQCTVFGAWAWLDAHEGSLPVEADAAGLVPVTHDPRGDGYLDATGRAHLEDEIEGMLDDLDTPTGVALITRSILFLLCPWTGGRKRKGSKGTAWAKQLGITKVLAGERESWWASDRIAIREAGSGDGATTQAWALRSGDDKLLSKLK